LLAAVAAVDPIMEVAVEPVATLQESHWLQRLVIQN
jgi:hypothetical protein